MSMIHFWRVFLNIWSIWYCNRLLAIVEGAAVLLFCSTLGYGSSFRLIGSLTHRPHIFFITFLVNCIWNIQIALIAQAIGDLRVTVGYQEALPIIDSEFKLLTRADHEVSLKASKFWNVYALNGNGPWLLWGELSDYMNNGGWFKYLNCAITCI